MTSETPSAHEAQSDDSVNDLDKGDVLTATSDNEVEGQESENDISHHSSVLAEHNSDCADSSGSDEREQAHENAISESEMVVNKIVSSIVDKTEIGYITSYDLKNHSFNGWLSVNISEESVSRINVLYLGSVVYSLDIIPSAEDEDPETGVATVAFTIDALEIIPRLIDVIQLKQEDSNFSIDINSFEFESADSGVAIDCTEGLKNESTQFDLETLCTYFYEYKLIATAFDPIYYENAYGEFYDTRIDAVCHFITEGYKKNWNPNSEFKSDSYIYRHADVDTVGCNPFYHYLKFGKDEGRQYSYGDMKLTDYRTDDARMLSEYFDVEFYWYTNPDMVGNEKALDHYLVHGWREGRDPCPAFDTSYYLEYNPDIRSSGMNPLYHYLKYGRHESRHSIRSRRVFAASAKPSFSGMPGYGKIESTITTSVVVMVKNEFDIIKSFASHLLGLFDQIVFIDHNSKDGTLEFIESLAENDDRVSIFHLLEESYIQAVTMNFIVRELDVVKESDWVFLLDCDEFLPYRDRSELDMALESSGDQGIVHFYWKNLIPVDYWDYEASIDSSTEFLVPDEQSIYGKIAFKTELLEKSDALWIAQGNHALLNHKDGDPLPSHNLPDPLYHLPVRSVNQLALKLNQGVVSYLNLGAKRDSLEGLHWFNILSNLENKVLSPGMLNRLVVEYGDNKNWTPVSTEQLVTAGYNRQALSIAFEPLLTSAVPKNDIASLILQTGASLASGGASDTDIAIINQLSFENSNQIVRAANDTGYEYTALPFINEQQSRKSHQTDFKFVSEFIKPSYWRIDNLTPTAWGGHIPFLFCLVTMAAPRRFAELGSHFGASFFAYCQASQRMGYKTVPVAIDCWEGDDHTGSYESDVFEQFKHVFSKYESFARYKRMFFADAVEYFEEKSVDLLHIDGLHTYEAVKEDYDIWLHTLSDTGVIIFHDINVHEREFGVWQFWSELKNMHPTMEFMHSHGLGVAYVGSDMNHPIMRLIEIFNSDSVAREFLQHHFETVSQEKITLAMNEYALQDSEIKDSTIAELNHQIGMLTQQVNSLSVLNESYADLITAKNTA